MAIEDWDEDDGRVSHAFNDWETNIGELHGFFEHATRSCDEEFQQRWSKASDAAEGTEYDAYFVFETWSAILPRDLAFLLRAMVVKEAFTAFEVYLEHGIGEARRALGESQLGGPDGRPVPWGTLVDCYAKLGKSYAGKLGLPNYVAIAVEDTDVQYAATLRHVLTHRRGHPQGERDRQILADLIDPGSDRVQLTDEVVARVIDGLGLAARRLDPLIWVLAWDRRVRGRVLKFEYGADDVVVA